jgi:hypothetical protein
MATTLLNAWIYKTSAKFDPTAADIDLTSTAYKRYRDGFYIGNTTAGTLVVEDKDGDERTYDVGAYTTMHLKGCTKVLDTSTVTSCYALQMCD